MAPKRLSDHRHTFQFPIGALVFSEGIDRAMRECGLDPLPQFRRHARADWGDVTDEQWQANNAALLSGGGLESLYVVHRELSIRIVTEADRSATYITLTSEPIPDRA
ncbi:hypothetical protein KKY53_10990 [Pseudomonas aeruginosa]|uniref:hypothetical protein n=1 Tax=Pseudomonas aeruginosa TaxID=287 RepID=UPI00053D00EE|nr:hypothetical protein [Pseudomonas aeruginosa]WCV81043.1 hypothetical protein KKY53_10990 [Pseudomonas aeruginosa]HBO0859767.1 hypothetical protein [Pseudomonas aeruginosa]HCE6879319.1 hypothetical protein [Pseudomonas aeruginosa]HDR2971123.1 hypothetical protein [Pseudomonas aeruginosa]